MTYERRTNPARADEVLRDLVDGTIWPDDAADELWCMGEQREARGDDPGEALSRFKWFGLGFEASDSDEFDVDAHRAEVLTFAREVLTAGGVDAYDHRLGERDRV